MRSLVILLFLLLSPLCLAQSFDCGKAATTVEKMICGSDELKQQDSELGAAYEAALKNAGEKAAIVQDNQQWWLTVRDNCTDATCLDQAYAERIAWLKNGEYKWYYTYRTAPWPEEEKKFLNEMYELYKKNGFYRDYRSDDFVIKLMKMELEYILPVAEAADSSSSAYKAALGPCVGLDLNTVYWIQLPMDKAEYKTMEDIQRYLSTRYSPHIGQNYRLYLAEIDNNSSNGFEYLQITDSTQTGKIANTDKYFKSRYLHYVPISPADGCSDKYNKDPFVINWGYVQGVAHVLAYDKPLYGVALYKNKGISYKLELISGENNIPIYSIHFLNKGKNVYFNVYRVSVK